MFAIESANVATGTADAAIERAMDAFRACDRTFLRRQRELQAVTAGRAS
jgi:hypothetical protein